MKPVFTIQFFFGNFLNHVQKLLRDETFEFTEGLLLKNLTYLFYFVRHTLSEDQFPDFPKHWGGRSRQVSLQFFLALELSQLRESIARKLQHFRHLLINVCSVWRRRKLLASQQL